MRRVVALGGLMAVASAFGLPLLPKVSTTSQEEPRVIAIASVVATPSLRFSLRAGGTEGARGWVPLAKREQPYPHTVPLAKRGEPHGGERLINPERAIGITPAFENPLLKVPPARRGNRAGARLGSPEAGATLPTRGSPREARPPHEAGATLRTVPLAKREQPYPRTVPLAKREQPYPRTVPLAKRERPCLRAVPLAKREQPYPRTVPLAKREQPYPRTVPLAKRGEP
jgi:hypothetical protein